LQYIEHLNRIIRHTCPSCHRIYCIACGEAISAEKTQRPNAAAGDNPLFHCSDIQGVILGNGLSMLEQVYANIIQEHTDDGDPNARTIKRRKMDVSVTPSHVSTPDFDDDDDVYYGALGHGKGKKAKGGTGYAGDGKEDVSLIPALMKMSLMWCPDFRTSRSPRQSTPKGREDREITHSNPRLPSFASSAGWWPD
jgi:hypothetical protein